MPLDVGIVIVQMPRVSLPSVYRSAIMLRYTRQWGGISQKLIYASEEIVSRCLVLTLDGNFSEGAARQHGGDSTDCL